MNLVFTHHGFTQSIKRGDFSLKRLLSLSAQDSCNEVLPAPEVINKPRYIAGNRNTICFNLPDRTLIPFANNEILNPFVVTVIRNLSTGELFQFPRSVNLENDSLIVESVESLQENTDHAYSTALFVPVCKVDCDEVVDNSQLELYCSSYQDTVFSYQDSEVPDVKNINIPQLSESVLPGWINLNSINVEGDLFDIAGVWKANLYVRTCGQGEWTPATDSTYSRTLSDSGFVFGTESQFSFYENLDDGCYEFLVEGVDATHTPESCAPNFILHGNERIPKTTTQPHIMVNVDTQPPDSVELSCSQILNSIELKWTLSNDIGIGLAGYRVLRDGEVIDTLEANESQFIDIFTSSTPTTNFSYQIQPFDSLENIQTLGGVRTCPFIRFDAIQLVAEPEFTAGDTNEVCWRGSNEITNYEVFLAINSDYDNAVSQNVTDTCFVFRNLQDGETYSYWVKAVDMQSRIILSDTVFSIQDASFPEIVSFDVQDLISLNGRSWTPSQELKLTISSKDLTPGILDSLEIIENGQPRFFEKLPGTELLNTEINYVIETQSCSKITLLAKIYDAAGNTSLSDTISFFLDDSSPTQVTNLSCTQINEKNGVMLLWAVPDNIDDCSGFAGLKIIRDGQEVNEVSPDVRHYEDILADDTPSGNFTYQFQPFDSLGNLQTQEGFLTCEYVAASSITIQPLPKFTQGLDTEICWSTGGSLNFLNVFIDANCDSVADDSVFIQQPSRESCYSFTGLEDGQKYCFWVTGVDGQQRRVQSSIVSTIQDNTSPIIEKFNFPGGETVNGRVWTYSREIELSIVARDFNNGQIWDYIIEEGQVITQQNSFPDSLTAQNEIITYDIKSAINNSTQITLKLKVLDGAGNESDYADLVLSLQESPPKMFAFPNPFNPHQENLTIRMNETTETELNIYDFFGNLVRTLTEKSNTHDFTWNGRNGDNSIVANGGYICVGTNTKARFKIGVVKQN